MIEKTKESGAMHDAARVFVCNSGSEANEAAIKFARKVGKVVGGEHKIDFVSFKNSFHGRTMGSLSATPNPKYQQPFAPMLPGFKYGVYNEIEGLNKLIDENTCGVIVEPIQGEGGVYEATTEFLMALRKRCNDVGAVLIYDEIQVSCSSSPFPVLVIMLASYASTQIIPKRTRLTSFSSSSQTTVRSWTNRTTMGPRKSSKKGSPRHSHHR